MTLNFQIPTSWNGLSDRQRALISDLMVKTKTGNTGVFISILYHLFCPSRGRTWRGVKERYKFLRLLLQVPVSGLLPYADFLFEKMDLTRFPDSVTIDGRTYHGPADRLSDISIEELNFSHRFYFDWETQKDAGALDRLVTTLYRPVEKTDQGIIREEFDMAIIRQRGSILPKMPAATKAAIGLAYRGSVEYMFSKYPIIFPPPPKKQTAKKSDKKPRYKSLVPMINAMFMGETQPLGPRKEVIKTNAYIFFDIAQETVLAARKREKEMKRRK